MEQEKVVGAVPFGKSKTAGEVYFQLRDDPKSEDDGYVMGFIYDYETMKSEFCMWDGITMEPVVNAPLKQRVPHGFHAIFIKNE